MTRWTRRDTATFAALALLSGLIRIPFRSTQIYHFDSYSLSAGALLTWTAHPPGFIGYCTLGRLVNYLLDDVNASFVAVSIVSTALATALVFALGREMSGYAVGVIAAVFWSASRGCWRNADDRRRPVMLTSVHRGPADRIRELQPRRAHATLSRRGEPRTEKSS